MKVFTTDRFDRDYRALPLGVRRVADRQLAQLAIDPGHPSIRLKKTSGFPDVWEARITRNYRLTLTWEGDSVTLRRIGTHDLLTNP